MPLFAVFLLVFELRHVLVALDDFGSLARLVEIQLAGVLGADGHLGEQPFEVLPLAFRTRGRVAGPHELLELMVAPAALVFVDRHAAENSTMCGLARGAVAG